jgi:phenylalanyl-tRNA synthetase beta chain
VKLFEIGKAFAASAGETGLPNEQELLALVVTGGELMADRAMPERDLDLYDAKGAVEAALNAAGVTGVAFAVDEATHLRRGQAAAVHVAGRPIGYVGRLSDEIAARYKFRQALYVAEVDLKTALQLPVSRVVYEPLARYPGIVRDISFVTGRDLTFEEIRNAIIDEHFDLCRSVMFVDVYQGKGLAEHERSITVRIEYRSDEKTLVEDEVESQHNLLISHVEARLGIKVRS